MTDNRLDEEFIAKQKRRLLDMKAELERMRDGLEADARWWGEEEEDFTQHDSGDSSLSLFTRELDLTIDELNRLARHPVAEVVGRVHRVVRDERAQVLEIRAGVDAEVGVIADPTDLARVTVRGRQEHVA